MKSINGYIRIYVYISSMLIREPIKIGLSERTKNREKGRKRERKFLFQRGLYRRMMEQKVKR